MKTTYYRTIKLPKEFGYDTFQIKANKSNSGKLILNKNTDLKSRNDNKALNCLAIILAFIFILNIISGVVGILSILIK